MDLLIELALAKRDAAKAKDALAAEEAAPALVAARTKARNTADLMKYLEGAVKEAWKNEYIATGEKKEGPLAIRMTNALKYDHGQALVYVLDARLPYVKLDETAFEKFVKFKKEEGKDTSFNFVEITQHPSVTIAENLTEYELEVSQL